MKFSIIKILGTKGLGILKSCPEFNPVKYDLRRCASHGPLWTNLPPASSR